ncbi:MAG: TonB-dependent receptor, partial [Bacteroidetes bacterium]|nr:TonB-dependent receptor [Bacteroidota bacterium]
MKKLLILFLFLMILPSLISAEGTFRVKGKVTDSRTKEPLLGASVVLKPSNIGAATDLDGNYSFDVPISLAKGQKAELVASYVNYKKKTVSVTLQGTEIIQNFALEEDVFQNEEVVVTGIASKTSKGVAEISVSRIPAAELSEKQMYQGLSQLLSGKVSGVNVSISTGTVGSAWNFFVRGGGGINGNGQPLIYIDGVRVENLNLNRFTAGGSAVNTLSLLNPSDIENIEILKGPAAASTYGTDASNGVVLITTKGGKYRLNDTQKNYSIGYQFDYGTNSLAKKYPSEFINADTINGVLNTSGIIREHSLNITGGSGIVRYYASYQNRFESGLIPDQNYLKRNSVTANFAVYPAETFTVKFNSSYSWQNLRRPRNDDSQFGWIFNALEVYPAYANANKATISAFNDSHTFNQFLGSGALTWNPVASLDINASAGINYNTYVQDRIEPYGYAFSTTTGTRAVYNRDSRQMTYDLNAKYSFRDLFVDNLNLNAVAGTQIITTRIASNSISVQGFSNADMYNLGSASILSSKDDSFLERREAGIYLDLPFSYDNTYFWTLGIRRDYSSAVGIESPSINYPHASLAVRLDKFGFLPSDINMAKVRATYGESGQLPNNDDGLPLNYHTFVGGTGIGGAAFEGVGNPAIEPERIKEYELGLDVQMFDMISLEFTYYKQNAEKSIIRSSFAPSTGLGDYTFPYNLGSVSNHGFETLLQIDAIKETDYALSLSLIWNYQKNIVNDLGGASLIQAGRETVLKVGLPKYEFYDYKVLGATFDANGKYKGSKVSDTQLDLGSPFPDHSGSITINFRFLKNFTLYGLAEWGLNNKVFSYTTRRAVTADGYIPYLELKAKLGLTAKAPLPNIAPLTPGTPEYIDAANQFARMDPNYYGNFITDADYFYLRELSLSYDFTQLMSEFIPNSYVTGLQAGVSVRNVFKLTKYLLDPELNYRSDLQNTGTDF